ncbi:hypothetical protein OHC33_003654 [Knufia fluminis]|uniref:Major facilitator superfamily (MFS) profile domain-containing protein n=1 Tax=Knufia fluminis TaxID=191047 RepID=A0AAN8ES79_9EURO|nr:hypothetical protein OHC33_003654 [Knufia fluminis]
MKLTRSSSSASEDSFPAFQLFLLSICRLAEPIALTSIFPYAWLMVQDFHVGNPDDASFYAGILISAFSLCEAAVGMFWGALSDRIGRKPVMLMGCGGTLVSLLMVGFSRSFGFALAGRAVGGLLNGNIGVIQTMVGELVKNPKHEPRAYAIMPFVWNVGCIIGPAVGGTFANPVRGFPTVFPKGGFFDKYPWALPNLVCAAIMLFSIVLSWLCLEETHPDLCKDADPAAEHDIEETTPMIAAGNSTDLGVDLRRGSYGTMNQIDVAMHDEWTVGPTGSSRSSISEKEVNKWFTWKVAMIVTALGIYTYHSMCYDHLLPIFFQDKRGEELNILTAFGSLFHIEGGLGLETKTVGLIMSVNGIIALFIQAVIFPFVVDYLGVWHTFMMVTILHPVAFFIVPYLVLLPSNLLFAGIYFCLFVRQLLSILDYPVILIMLKQACPAPRYLGKINGLAASVGAGCRMIAPPIAGLLYAKGRKLEFTGLAYWGAGAVALFGVLQLFSVPRDRDDEAHVRSLARCISRDRRGSIVPREVVNVTVIDEDSDVERQH